MELASIEINNYITLLFENNVCIIKILGENFMKYDIFKLKDFIPKYKFIENIERFQNIFPDINQDDLYINAYILISNAFELWVKHKYNTDFLKYQISFPLLRELVQIGDLRAKKVFYNEIIKNLWGQDSLFLKFLIREKYDKYVEIERYKRRIHIPERFKDLKFTFFICFLLLTLYIIYANFQIFHWFDLNESRIFEHYEIWRYFTSMFEHHGKNTLFINLILLIAFGSLFEVNNLFSYKAYIIIYLVSGLVGNIFFFLVFYDNTLDTAAAGASGSIFGIIGALITITITKERYFRTIIIILLVGFFLFQSIDSRVNFTAHFFGLLAGMFTYSLFYIHDSYKQKKNYMIKRPP
ncbi:MAG: rhomboid family intramembrane serine protease [Candidatus Lokiarchaeota archaeon]|nr:rhomboid family intramembrane serine protease [Candidatus Lokiarchaeota archaeon]